MMTAIMTEATLATIETTEGRAELFVRGGELMARYADGREEASGHKGIASDEDAVRTIHSLYQGSWNLEWAN